MLARHEAPTMMTGNIKGGHKLYEYSDRAMDDQKVQIEKLLQNQCLLSTSTYNLVRARKVQ